MNKTIKLSILDQSPINKGETAVEALKNTTQLAILADNLGYTRYWVSEHHNINTLAGTAPEILVAHLASHTKKIRIGSGGIMLPNHSALKMAENFKLLEALYPNRIDMGIGRAPGTDRLTASLLNPTNKWDEQDFIDQLYDLGHFLHDDNKIETIFSKVKAGPQISTMPKRWLLTSSGESAMIAARFGLAISYAQFINPYVASDIIEAYKENFEPSVEFNIPQANVAIFAFCNEDDTIVKHEQAIMDHRFIQLERGTGSFPVDYKDIEHIQYSQMEQQRIRQNRGRTIYATPDEMKKRLTDLAHKYNIDEIMLVSYAQNFAHRLHSYELLAEMFDLTN